MRRTLAWVAAVVLLALGMFAGFVVPSRASGDGAAAITYTYPTGPATTEPPATSEPATTTTSSESTPTTTAATPPASAPPTTTTQTEGGPVPAVHPATVGPPGTSYVVSATLDASDTVALSGGAVQARGIFSAGLTLTGAKATLTWRLTFAGLTDAAAASVRLGAAGTSGKAMIPLCSPCRSGAQGVFRGAIGKSLLAAILGGGAYVDIRTAGTPAGELRGQTFSWLSYQAARKSATLTLVQSLDHTAGGFNLDGHAHGSLSVSVPRGWNVSVRCSNAGSYSHSCVIVKSLKTKELAFPGSGSPRPTEGIAPGKTTGFRFVATRAGTYRIACLVPGHIEQGMWNSFVVTSSGLPSLKVAQPAG